MSNRHDLDLTQATRRAVTVTPNDSTDLDRPTRGLYIGTAGTITVIHVDDTAPVTYPTTVAGLVYPWAVRRVYSTGTTALNIFAQY